jgi:hypothetical protein
VRKKLTLWALNDFAEPILLRTEVAGVAEPLTAGVVTGFLSTSFGPEAEPAHASLEAPLTHVGNGRWMMRLDGAVLTPALLDPIFANASMYLIVEQEGGIRAWWKVIYARDREGELA